MEEPGDERVVSVDVCEEGDEGVEAGVADHPPEPLDLQHVLPPLAQFHPRSRNRRRLRPSFSTTRGREREREEEEGENALRRGINVAPGLQIFIGP